MLKKIVIISMFIYTLSFAQFKDKDLTPSIMDGITNYSTSGLLSNFLNPKNLHRFLASLGIALLVFVPG